MMCQFDKKLFLPAKRHEKARKKKMNPIAEKFVFAFQYSFFIPSFAFFSVYSRAKIFILQSASAARSRLYRAANLFRSSFHQSGASPERQPDADSFPYFCRRYPLSIGAEAARSCRRKFRHSRCK